MDLIKDLFVNPAMQYLQYLHYRAKSAQPQFIKENPRKYGMVVVGLGSYGNSDPTIYQLS